MIRYIAVLSLLFSQLCFSADICQEMKRGHSQGESWFKITIPGNAGSPFYRAEQKAKQLFLSIDIDNDGELEQIGEFYGGTAYVPYVVIWNNNKVEEFGSDKCGGGSASSIDVVATNSKNYLHISIKEIVQQDCGISGYLVEYVPENLFGRELCSISTP